MNKLHFTALSLCLMAIGCTNDESFYEQSEIDDNGVVVLQERNAALPKEIRTRPVILEDKTATRAVNESGGIIGNSDVLLGYSYSIGNSILGDYENVISPVIDLMKVKEYGSDYITGRSLQVYMSERFSYSDYNSYESKLSQTKKVASGFQLNLGLFKLGRKKKTEETFKSELTSSQKVVYGELNLMLKNSSFNLQASDGARKFYARECLSPVFLRNLYSSTLGNILDTYGECILTGYITGGKACALYTGLSRNGSSSTSKETGMEKSPSWSVIVLLLPFFSVMMAPGTGSLFSSHTNPFIIWLVICCEGIWPVSLCADILVPPHIARNMHRKVSLDNSLFVFTMS